MYVNINIFIYLLMYPTIRKELIISFQVPEGEQHARVVEIEEEAIEQVHLLSFLFVSSSFRP